ncbi:MAG: UDP-N-acetylmuramoyl-L-alanine--D-glutamate ligase [Planctomycetota bacterium]|nr:UDP-N-acetylmuramoyl-L-alanine--D-glutamate ligase [Planctomycetota bacterium]
MSTRFEFEGRRVTVQGLGLFGGGAAVARFLARRGARVTVTDTRTAAELAPAIAELAGIPVRFVLGEHRREDFAETDLVVANPAVAPSNAWLSLARAAGVPITSEIALFLELCPARIAAVTGTQGKSSTCNTLHQLLLADGQRAHLGGNIGRSLVESAESMRADEVVVLEISSYQLESLPAVLGGRGTPPRVEAVCVTNVLADHLDRHGTLEQYAEAKRRILGLSAATGGWAVLSAEDPRFATWSDPNLRRLDAFPNRLSDRGLNVREGHFRFHREPLGRVADLRLPGTFQRDNTLLALGLARLLGADPARLFAAIPGLSALPHRMQDLGTFAGHRVWDNGVSTTPDSTLAVFGSLEPGFTLLVGGKHKDLPLEDLVRSAQGRVRRVVSFGKAGELLRAAFQAAGIDARAVATVPEAVEAAFEALEPGEALLFSPACASYDQYLNFQERALTFRRSLERFRAPSPETPERCLDKAGRGG